MKSQSFLILLFFSTLSLFSCTTPSSEEQAFSKKVNLKPANHDQPGEESDKDFSLNGTWKALARSWVAPTKKYADSDLYKIYTRDRFAFVYIEKGSQNFLIAGGGTYQFDGRILTEHIEYFSYDSEMVGTTQEFEIKQLENGLIWQKGRLASSSSELNPDLNEFYQKIGEGTSSAAANSPYGVWQAETATYGDNQLSESELQKKYGRVIKIITPNFFYGAFFDPGRKYFNGITFGKISFEGDEFTEEIMAYSWDNSATKAPVTFNWKVRNDRFHQSGKLNTDKYKDYTIREVYIRQE